MSVEFQHQFT